MSVAVQPVRLPAEKPPLTMRLSLGTQLALAEGAAEDGDREDGDEETDETDDGLDGEEKERAARPKRPAAATTS